MGRDGGALMSVVVVTGSAGLVGTAVARHFASLGMTVVGIDNCMREIFFGPAASVVDNLRSVERDLGSRYEHHHLDVRDRPGLSAIFARCGKSVSLVVHAAAQPSHNWAAGDPHTDFGINATGTLNVLDQVRIHCPDAVVVHCGSSTVYGDRLNMLPFVERTSRWDLPETHEYYDGLPEDAPIDQTKHTLFGASKLAADILAQEYGRYFGLRTTVLRLGQICGPALAATRQHGMPAFVVRSLMERRPYEITGFAGKQVRDLIHPVDLLAAITAVLRRPGCGAVYNLGGGRGNSFSVLEVIELAEEVAGAAMSVSFSGATREGDRKWWVTNNSSFARDHPEWRLTRSTRDVLMEIHQANLERWVPTV